MAVELEWRFDTEAPEEIPREERPPHRSRWRWLGLVGAVLLLVGVGLSVWWRSRHDVLATVESEVQAVAQLELRALTEEDTELYLSLQDDADPNWEQAQQTRAKLDILLPPPLPALTSTAVLSVDNARVVGDVARVEIVRMARFPSGEAAPFRAVRFYRRSDDGRWLHTRADLDYAGPVVVWDGRWIRIAFFAADRTWIEPLASELDDLAQRFCGLDGIIPCEHRRPLALDFTGTLDTAVAVEGVLPAPLIVGTPDDAAARATWEVGQRELLFEQLIVREVGQPLSSHQGWPRGGELFRARLHEWLRAELGLREPIATDLDLIGESLDTGEWIPLGALWYFTFADDDVRRALAEAEIDLLLAFIAEEYGRSQLTRPLHALRLAPRMEALIWQGLGETWSTFERRHAAYVREVTGRPFEPPGDVAAFASYDLVVACEGPSSLWGLRLDRPDMVMVPLLTSADFGLHSWSPDGAWLLVWRGAIQGGGLYLLESDGTAVRQLTSVPEGAWPIGWSPDGSRVAYATSGWPPEGGLVDVEADQSTVLGGHSFAWSPDGSQLAYMGEASYVWLAEGDGSNPHPVGEGYSISWSPDGTRIAFFSAESDLKVFDVTTGETRTVVDSSMLYAPFDLRGERVFVSGNSLAWSPTGEWIGFGVSQFGRTKLVEGGVALIHPDGGDLRISFSREAGVALTGWSPDGRWLTSMIQDRYDRARFTTTVVGIDGVPLLEADAWSVWSPGGRYLAVTEMDWLRVLELESGAWHWFELPAPCGPVVWNPRGPLHEPGPEGGHVTPP
jgi:Tol biopolymer transport system component